jgi:flagellar basal-body rod modification protein FlgD
METSAVSNTGLTTTTRTTGQSIEELRPEDFFALLITQLQTQDPLEPMDNAELVQQISQIRDMEASTRLTATLDELAAQQQVLAEQQRFGSSAGLIGKYVEGFIDSGEGVQRFVSGVVTGLRFDENGRPILELSDGSALPETRVSEVTTLEEVHRVADQLVGKRVRGEMPNETGGPMTVEGVVTAVAEDDYGLPVLVLDNGTELPLRYFTEIVGAE